MKWFAFLALVVTHCVNLQPAPFTIQLKDRSKTIVEARVTFQEEPSKGRKTLFVGDTNNGAVTIPAKDVPQGSDNLLLLIRPRDKKYEPRRAIISVEKLRKDSVVIIVEFDD